MLAGADDLVPVRAWDGSAWGEPASGPTAQSYRVRRFRPRIDGDHSRIELIAHETLGRWWRVTSRDNVTTWYGPGPDSRIVDPGDAQRVFAWLPAGRSTTGQRNRLRLGA